MSNRLQISGQAGLTVKAVFRDENGAMWNGESVVTYNAADYDDYKVALTAQGVHYYCTIPENLPAGLYHITYQDEVGGVLTETSEVIFQESRQWDGANLVDDLVLGSSIADICNLALSHLGVGTEIANLETDEGQEAETLRRFYNTVRDATLRDFAWPFATRIAALGLVEEDPNSEWDYSYRYPSSCLKVRRILSGTRPDNRQTQVSYKIAGDDAGRLLFTDQEDAEIEYTVCVTNPLRYPPDFIMALSLRLAAYIAPRLAGGDPFKLGDRAMKLYAYEVIKAEAQSANEEQQDQAPDSEFIRERG